MTDTVAAAPMVAALQPYLTAAATAIVGGRGRGFAFGGVRCRL